MVRVTAAAICRKADPLTDSERATVPDADGLSDPDSVTDCPGVMLEAEVCKLRVGVVSGTAVTETEMVDELAGLYGKLPGQDA